MKEPQTGSSTNLDKVIEAVSKGILDENQDNDTEFRVKSIEVKSLELSPVSGVQIKVDDSNGPLISPAKQSPQLKVKMSKKSRKEKEKVKGKEKSKERDEKTKEKKKEIKEDQNGISKEKGKGKVKEKDKIKHKEKSKDKTKDDSKINRVKKLKSVINANPANQETPDTTKIPKKDASNVQSENNIDEHDVDISLSMTNNSEETVSKTSQVFSIENSFNGQVSNGHNVVDNTIDAEMSLKNGESVIDHKRKRRKEKHRSKHGTDTERSSSKEHKKKRKRKSHDREIPLSDGVPKIKIKVQNMAFTYTFGQDESTYMKRFVISV